MMWSMDPPATRLHRQQMVRLHLMGRNLKDARVLAAMSRMPRECFVPPEATDDAYYDSPLPIGMGQTISQPYMVAVMAELLALQGDETVLEVGAGSGYGAAILSLLARKVVAVERLPQLLAEARDRWHALGLANIVAETGDGAMGCPQHAPYDAISVTAAAPTIPKPLVAQLKPHTGRMVIPVGSRGLQILTLVQRGESAGQYSVQEFFPCSFVPLISREAWPD